MPRKDGFLRVAYREAEPAERALRRLPSVDADAVELRVLGCLIEKQRTTPDAYPLSLNALRLACNQSTNRDPVVDYDEAEIRAAIARLSRREWVRLASGQGSRAVKYRHLLDRTLALTDAETALLGVLMLRGAQTPGELKQRTERLHRFGSLEEIEQSLEGLVSRELVVRLPRRPGQKEERYTQLLGGGASAEAPAEARAAPSHEPATHERQPAGDRLGELEREVRELRAEVAALSARLNALDG
jgi:uncharacterized protein YceH (UPF0502 family)